MRKQRGGRGGQRFTYQAVLQEGCGGEGREKETEKTCEKRLRAGAHAPPPPPSPTRPYRHPPFRRGAAGPLRCPPFPGRQPGCPHLGCRPRPGVQRRGWLGVTPFPGDPSLTFASLFLELEGVRGFFLDLVAGSLVLWGHRSAVRGDSPRLTSTVPSARIRPFPPVPFAWSLSSWLAVFFQSSILSCKGFIRLSMRALEQGERGQECGRAPEPGGSRAPYPGPSRRPASPSSEREG